METGPLGEWLPGIHSGYSKVSSPGCTGIVSCTRKMPWDVSLASTWMAIVPGYGSSSGAGMLPLRASAACAMPAASRIDKAKPATAARFVAADAAGRRIVHMAFPDRSSRAANLPQPSAAPRTADVPSARRTRAWVRRGERNASWLPDRPPGSRSGLFASAGRRPTIRSGSTRRIGHGPGFLQRLSVPLAEEEPEEQVFRSPAEHSGYQGGCRDGKDQPAGKHTGEVRTHGDDDQSVLYDAVGKAHEDAGEEDLARLHSGRSRFADQQPSAIGNAEEQPDRSERYRSGGDTGKAEQGRKPPVQSAQDSRQPEKLHQPAQRQEDDQHGRQRFQQACKKAGPAGTLAH